MFCGVRLFGFFVRMFVGLNNFSRFEYRRMMCFYPAVIFSVCHSVCSDVFLIIDTAASVVPPRTICRHSDCKIAALFLLSSAFSLSLPLSEIHRGRPGLFASIATARLPHFFCYLPHSPSRSHSQKTAGAGRPQCQRAGRDYGVWAAEIWKCSACDYRRTEPGGMSVGHRAVRKPPPVLPKSRSEIRRTFHPALSGCRSEHAFHISRRPHATVPADPLTLRPDGPGGFRPPPYGSRYSSLLTETS